MKQLTSFKLPDNNTAFKMIGLSSGKVLFLGNKKMPYWLEIYSNEIRFMDIRHKCHLRQKIFYDAK